MILFLRLETIRVDTSQNSCKEDLKRSTRTTSHKQWTNKSEPTRRTLLGDLSMLSIRDLDSVFMICISVFLTSPSNCRSKILRLPHFTFSSVHLWDDNTHRYSDIIVDEGNAKKWKNSFIFVGSWIFITFSTFFDDINFHVHRLRYEETAESIKIKINISQG